jgi:hypothetical protein
MNVVILSWSSTARRHLTPHLFVLFCYLLHFVVIVFTYLFFVLVFYLPPLSLVPAPYSTTESDLSWLCSWYFYYAIALVYDFPPYCFCFRSSVY